VLVGDDLGLVVHHLGDGISALGVGGDDEGGEAAYELGLGVEDKPLVVDDWDSCNDSKGDGVEGVEAGPEEATGGCGGSLLLRLGGGRGVECTVVYGCYGGLGVRG
jgi:hypothetical protein